MQIYTHLIYPDGKTVCGASSNVVSEDIYEVDCPKCNEIWTEALYSTIPKYNHLGE